MKIKASLLSLTLLAAVAAPVLAEDTSAVPAAQTNASMSQDKPAAKAEKASKKAAGKHKVRTHKKEAK
jgi:hypothetical protein